MTSGTERPTRYTGPNLSQWRPFFQVFFICWCQTYCVRFVSTARLTPHVMVCDSTLAPSLATNPISDARRRGQHHAPASAGMDRSAVSTDTTVDPIDPATSSSSPTFFILGFRDEGRGGMDQTPPSQSSSSVGMFIRGVRSDAILSLSLSLSLSPAAIFREKTKNRKNNDMIKNSILYY